MAVGGTPTSNDVGLLTDTQVVITLHAFARASDPENFPAGPVNVTDTFDEINLMMASPDGYTGYFSTMNSSIPGLEDLYTLDIVALSEINTVDDVLIAFTSNPLLGFDDLAIVNAIRSGMSVSGNTATLGAPFSLDFPLNWSSPYSLEYSSSSYSGDNQVCVPEPATAILLALGGLGFFRRRRPMA